MVEGITTTQSLGNSGYSGKPLSKAAKPKKVVYDDDATKTKEASGNLSKRLTPAERDGVRFNEMGNSVFEDADIYFIELWVGPNGGGSGDGYRYQYEQDENGNLYSGGRGKGHLPEVKVLYKYPQMIPVPIEEHINSGDLRVYYQKGCMLEADMPEAVKKDLLAHRRKNNFK